MSDLTGQLVEQVRQAAGDSIPLAICGRGSKSFYGRACQARPVEVAGHQGVVQYSPQELVITVRAGTSLAEVDSILAEKDQQLAFDPPRFAGEGSVGGSLACNLSGPARPWVGSIRDALLGLRLINGRGEHLRFGGQVIKNVAGYDVSRMQAGAMGCLGIMTELSFKVMPRCESSRHLVHDGFSVTDALEYMARLQLRPLPLAGACYLDGQLHLRLAGAVAAVDTVASELVAGGFKEGPGDGFWTGLRDHGLEFFQGSAPLWRFSVGSTVSLPLDGECLIDWGGAQRWFRGTGELQDLADIIPAGRGEVCLYRGGVRDGEVFIPPADPLKRLHQRLKKSFDPDLLFNPGRLYGWL